MFRRVICPFLAALIIAVPSWAQTPKKSAAPVAAKPDTTLKQPASPPVPMADTARIPVLDFRNTDIRDVLRSIATRYEVNVWLAPEVKGEVSLHLVNLPVKEAITFIVQKYGFATRVENGVLQVIKPEVIAPVKIEAPIVVKLEAGKVTVDATEAPVDRFIRTYGDSTRLNIVLDKALNGIISAHLRGLEPDKALRIVLESNGFDLDVSDGVYYVTKPGWSGAPVPGGSQATTPKPGATPAATPMPGGGSASNLKRSAVVVKDTTVSLQVTGGSLNEIIKEISNQSNIDIFIYGQVDGQISARCKDLTIDEALRYLLQNTKYTFWKNQGIYFIGDKESAELNTSELISVNYLKADGVVDLLPKSISTAATIKVVKEQNALMVIGPYNVIAAAKDFVKQIDQPVAQILIEAVVIDFSVNKLRDYGVKFFTNILGDSSRFQESFFPSVQARAGTATLQKGMQDIFDRMRINQIVSLPKDFMAQVSALERAGVAKVRSTPQVATLNGNQASISVGSTQYYLLKTNIYSPGTTTGVISEKQEFQKIEANVSLTVTPWVTSSKEVTVQIKPEFNTPKGGFVAGQPPTIDKRVIESTVRLKNGETIILGGLRETTSSVNEDRLPILGSIPVIGWLFRNRSIEERESQLMIFLTPHIYFGTEGSVQIDSIITKDPRKSLFK